jgi:hypothetical protein
MLPDAYLPSEWSDTIDKAKLKSYQHNIDPTTQLQQKGQARTPKKHEVPNGNKWMNIENAENDGNEGPSRTPQNISQWK